MNEIIENTLHIISKISASRQGYLLQLSDQGYGILNIWGGKQEDFTSLNDLLFKLFKAGGIDTEKVASLPSVLTFLKERFSSSFFIKDLIFFSERNQFVYILLFSDNVDEFREESKNRIIPILSILSHQVKTWIELQTEKEIIPGEDGIVSAKGKRLIDEWENRFNLLIKTSPDLIFILDEAGKIVLINEASKNYLEYSPDEMKGKYFLDFVSKEDTSLINISLSKVLTEKKPIKFKIHLLTKYGKIFPLELSCNTIFNHHKVVGLLAVGKDLSEKYRYEMELQKLKPKVTEINRLLNIERSRVAPQKSVVEELNRLKYDFISSISHEFRTTLASIIGFSETIVSDPDLGDSMKEEFIKVIMSEGKRLAKLINYFLDTPSTDDNMIMINTTTFGLIKLVQDAINANNELAISKNININFEHPSEEVFIEADRDSLYQVINALINNAIRFTDELGRVKIVVNNFVREVEILVSDTGIGIPEEDQPYIFQRFFRVSRRLSDIPSVGVGLVFVKQIIDLHKGLITVQSEAGSGTTFLVKLPKRSKIDKNEVNLE
ncbi:MAG: PAS domain-containing sensor histidine kinase [Ignavibacteriaceae bacterium]|jgi:PAS domain S-box-containing protein|nr:PAS domain-containing sensor histidine kinase [Ignavibacteriaceae bacterium]